MKLVERKAILELLPEKDAFLEKGTFTEDEYKQKVEQLENKAVSKNPDLNNIRILTKH